MKSVALPRTSARQGPLRSSSSARPRSHGTAALSRCPLRVRAGVEDSPQTSAQSQQWRQPQPSQPLGAARFSRGEDFQASPSSSPGGAGPSTSQQAYQDELLQSLRLNRYWARNSRPAINLLSPGVRIDLLQELPEVHVIVFAAEEHEQEGVYSHRSVGKDGLPVETIIGFQSDEDAQRYACQLEVTMEPHTPRVLCLPTEELLEFCVERGYQCRVERSGTRLAPPERSVDLTDWERSQRLRQNQFAVLQDGEVHPEFDSHQQQLLDLYLDAGNPPQGVADAEPELLLDNIRSRLEALLPPPEEQEGEEKGEQ